MSNKRIRTLFLILVIIATAFWLLDEAQSATLSWQPDPTRENGSAIATPLTYEVWVDNQLIYSGPETGIEVELGIGTTCYELYQVADGVRGRSLVRCFQLRAIPPLPPKP